MIGTSWVNTVFVRDDLPEFGTNLVTALAGLYVDDFTVITTRKKERMQYQSSEMEQGNGDTQRDTQRKKM